MKAKRKKPSEPRVAAAPTLPVREETRGSDTATKVSASVGIVAAMVLGMLVNVFVARHYKRWDWTRGGLYTLSEATVATLHGVGDPVKIHVLLPSGDALTLSVAHLLEAYRGETSQLDVDFLDPDRRTADFLALAQRYALDAERRDGHVIAGAAAIVVRGDRHEIVRSHDLVELDQADDLRRRPRLEQAFTGAIRAVTSADHPKACFSAGHGETQSQPLREHLARSGYQLESVEPARAGDPTALDGCTLLVVAGPTERVPAADASRFKEYVEKGGSALVAVGPQPDNGDRGYLDLGLGELLAAAGIKLDADFVFEVDPALRSPRGRGETFTPVPRPHPSTRTLMARAERGIVPVVTVASSLSATGSGSAATAPLLVTSDQAFGMVDFFAWAKTGTAPVPAAADKKGPLMIAMASELARAPGSAAPHGGRLIAVGSAGVLEGANWQAEDLRGTALFVESAIAWLTKRPPILDIPDKPAFTAGLRVSDAWLAGTFRYVIVYMPLAGILLGFAVYLRRRGTERRKDPKAG